MYSARLDLVLIGIEQIESLVLIQAFDHFEQGVRGQLIIVIQKAVTLMRIAERNIGYFRIVCS